MGRPPLPGSNGERMPSENELQAARFQGEHVARITARLFPNGIGNR